MKTALVCLGLSLLCGFLGAIVTLSPLIGAAVAGCYFLVGYFLLAPMAEKAVANVRKRHEAFRFVNTFVISLSVNHSGPEAFAAAATGAQGEELGIVEGLGEMGLEGKLLYLSDYFRQDFYRMFTSLYRLYEEQGGDVLKIAEPLLDEIALIEETESEKDRNRLANLAQFISLWAMSGLILAFLRFGLASFYESLASSPAFIITGVAYFVFALFSFCVYVKEMTGEKMRFGGKEKSYVGEG